MPRGFYPVGEGAGVGVIFFCLESGVQEPIKTNIGQGVLLYPTTSSNLLHFKNM